MKTVKKILFSIAFVLLVFLIFNKVYAASDFDFKKLEFTATLNQDGSMDVQETWQVKINDTTNTLFKTFNADTGKYGEIINVSVSEIEGGSEKSFMQSTKWKNHVDTDYFHALMHEGDFEIAWGVNKSSGNRTYIVKYTVTDVISLYSDCSELYWQFIGKETEMPIEQVTGEIILPREVAKKEDIKVWGHGQLNGEIYAKDTKTVTFSMAPYIGGSYLEIRVAVLDTEMFTDVTNRKETMNLDKIITEETEWAEEANRQREIAEAAGRNRILIIGGISTAIGAIFVYYIVKALKRLKETQRVEPTQKYEYYRDIPNENESPAEVAFLHYFRRDYGTNVMPKVLSSTLLDLSLKKYVTFEVNNSLPKKEQVTVKLIEDEKAEPLRESEELVLNLFKKIPKKDTNSFNMKEFEQYARKHNSSFLKDINKISQAAQKEQKECGHYDKKMEEKYNNWKAGGVSIVFILGFVSLFVLAIFEVSILCVIPAIVPGIIYSVMCQATAGLYSGLTQTGVDEKEKWDALKKYMNDFSMMKDKEVPELALWEKYLVYATLFGNADKVLSQLKTVYPEFSDDEYMRHYTYFYLLNHSSFNDSFVNSVNSAMTKAYESSIASSASSSGSGGGGGFSGGGGGRWRWWPDAVEDNQIQ